MKASIIVILAVIACGLLAVAGCTNTPATTTATPAATTVAADASIPSETTTVVPAPEISSWNGIWNTSYSVKDSADSIAVITMSQSGSSVTGIFHNGLGSIIATVQDNTISGTWHDSDEKGEYAGFFTFVKSADDKSFTGNWVSTGEGVDALKTTAQYWNGVRT